MRCIDISYDFDAIRMNKAEREMIGQLGWAYAFEALLNTASNNRYSGGLSGIRLKTFSRILKALDGMGKDGTVLKVEEAEYDLIKDLFLAESTNWLPSQTRLITTLTERIEKAGTSECCNKEKSECTEKATGEKCCGSPEFCTAEAPSA